MHPIGLKFWNPNFLPPKSHLIHFLKKKKNTITAIFDLYTPLLLGNKIKITSKINLELQGWITMKIYLFRTYFVFFLSYKGFDNDSS
jgi:hypothetical protein